MRPLHFTLLMLSSLLPLAAGAASSGPVTTNEPVLGRLFLTPEWRAALERQRQFNVQQTRRLESDSMRLDGIVVRSSGKSTVWINGQPQSENSRDTGVTAALSRHSPGQARLFPGTPTPIDLKVGATLDQATGEKHGGLADGEIRIHRHPASRP